MTLRVSAEGLELSEASSPPKLLAFMLLDDIGENKGDARTGLVFIASGRIVPRNGSNLESKIKPVW